MKQSAQQVKHKKTSAVKKKQSSPAYLRPHVTQSNHTMLANDKWERQTEETAVFTRNHSSTRIQQVLGNHEAFRTAVIQTKLTMNQPGDRYEQEADRLAEQVLRMENPIMADPFPLTVNRPGIRYLPPRLTAEINIVKDDRLQAKEVAGTIPKPISNLQDQISALRTCGGSQSLPARTRTFFESRFGHDFSRVRIHTDVYAAGLATSLHAKAFTFGRDIAFASGKFAPYTEAGKKLLAHELTHTIQQGASAPYRTGAERIQGQMFSASSIPAYRIQRQCPAGITYNLGNRHPAHVPHCGAVNVTATAQPAGIPNLTWSLLNKTVAVAVGTTINARGRITIDPAQTPGEIWVRAEQPAAGCLHDMPLIIRSHPTGITNTIPVGGPPNPADDYGGVFDHVFTPHSGTVADLQNVAVGERFPNLPNPNGAVHANIPTPFGPFTLHTATLTANATNNWFLDAQGRLNGTDDRVTFEKAGVNVGRFLQSVSNPAPTHALPASFTIDQDLHWYCRLQPAANRWTQFVRVQHTRALRQAGNNIEFVTTVNRVPRTENYTGHPAIFNARAVPNRVMVSPSAGAPNTAMIRADSLPDPVPAGHALNFSIRGNAYGAAINAATGLLTAGSQSGRITVRARDSVAANPNFDQVSLQIDPPQIINARAVPNRVTVSPAVGNAHTVTVRADTIPHPLPAGHALSFLIQGNNLGCNINVNTGVLTVGRQIGAVVVRVRDTAPGNPNLSDVTINIVSP